MKTSCDAFGLMTDVVRVWLKDNRICYTDDQYYDLIARLKQCDIQMSQNFSCKKRGKRKLEQELEEIPT